MVRKSPKNSAIYFSNYHNLNSNGHTMECNTSLESLCFYLHEDVYISIFSKTGMYDILIISVLAFCGMLLWEISPGHMLNDFEINKFHNIRSGIILHGSRAYVFTQITNDDIHSHLKILMRGKSLKHNIPTSKGATMLRKYVRFKSTERILPSIHQL